MRKHGYVIRCSELDESARLSAIREFAQAAARELAPRAHRVILYIQGPTQDPHRCVDMPQPIQAILMVWPKGDAKLPDPLRGSKHVTGPTTLELVNYSSNVPFPKKDA